MSSPNNISLVSNPPNRFHQSFLEWIDSPPVKELRIYEEHSKSIISKNNSPDIGFTYSINPYRGCFHGCAYCYARPTHQYLDWGAGSDFERKIVAKVNAADLLKLEFDKKSWAGEDIVFSGVTDCYQPIEASYELTRKCLEVCLDYRNPVAIITKGALIRRDIDLLVELSKQARVFVYISVAFSDDTDSKLIEPYAPRPSVRFRAIEALSKSGINVGIGVAPVIPGLSDRQIPQIIKSAADAGATRAFMTLLRLPAEVKQVFQDRLIEAMPTKSDKILNQLRAMRSGKLNQSDWGARMRGSGHEWEAIKFLFDSACSKYKMNLRSKDNTQSFETTFRRPSKQLNLFD